MCQASQRTHGSQQQAYSRVLCGDGIQVSKCLYPGGEMSVYIFHDALLRIRHLHIPPLRIRGDIPSFPEQMQARRDNAVTHPTDP